MTATEKELIEEIDKVKKTGTIIKVFQSKRRSTTGKDYDVVLLMYRDENGIKRVKCYDRPEITYYLLKDRNAPEAKFPPLYIERDKVELQTTYPDMLYRDIAIKTNCTAFYDKVMFSKGEHSEEMKNLFRHPLVYDADMNISDRMISKFQEEYEPDIKYQLHKCFFDIEVDLMENGDEDNSFIGFPDESIAPCPVNIITFIDGKSMIIHTFILNNIKNESMKEFAKNIDEFKADVLNKIRTKDNCNILENKIYWFDDELSLIKSFFEKVHDLDPDFMIAWNETFDVNTLINRLTMLLGSTTTPEMKARGITGRSQMMNIVCDLKYSRYDTPDGSIFVQPKVNYYNDSRHTYGRRIDYFTVLDGINWCDAMYYFANIHAASGKRDSYKLDAIAYEELDGKEKLPFYPGQTIKNIPWKKFSQFYEYNVRDVLLLLLLENKNLDFSLLQQLSEITSTRKEKVISKSVSLPNYVNKFARSVGYVMNCNKNMVYYRPPKDRPNDPIYDEFGELYLEKKQPVETDPAYLALMNKKDKYGAFVSDPMKNEHVGVEIIPGERSMHVYHAVCDQDLSSLYPSIIRAYNLDSTTEEGKFFLYDPMLKDRLKTQFGFDGLFNLSNKDTDDKEEEVFDDDESEEADDDASNNKKKSVGETNDLGPMFVDAMMSQNWSEIGNKYFLLPTIDEIYSDIDEIIKNRS